MATSDLAEKAAALLRLHHQDQPLLLCNVWDAASARIVESAGLPAVATTSSGIANSLGYRDGENIPRKEMLDVVRRIARVVQVPITADLENGYGDVEGTTQAMLDAGAVGLNFEDFSQGAMVAVEDQADQIQTIRETAASKGVHVVINARIDVYIAQVGKPETRFERTLARALAYHEAGADCIFVPFLTDLDTIAKLVKALPLPLNILATKGCPSVSELARVGVKRISVGGGIMRASMGLTKKIVDSVLDTGTYDSYTDILLPAPDANALFGS